jgi:hypothetical protein
MDYNVVIDGLIVNKIIKDYSSAIPYRLD